MPENSTELQTRLADATRTGFRERLLDRGLDRGLIWRDGQLPLGAPPFADSLTDDLLDYAHTIFLMAIQLHAKKPENPVLQQAFLIAGEAIEAAVHRGNESREDRGFNR